MRMFPLIKKKHYHTMGCLIKTGGRVSPIIMAPIDEIEEHALDERTSFTITRGDTTFVIGPTNVKYYGTIDFHSGSEDYAILEESTLFHTMGFQGAAMPANYDYEKHCCYSDRMRALWFDTVNAAMLGQYAHGILGKPKRVVIFEL